VTAAGQDGPTPDPQPVDVEWLDSLGQIKAREHDPIPSAAGQDGDGTRVTAVDLTNGGSESQTIRDDYVLVCDGSAHLDSVQVHGNGTHVITVKGVKRRGP
jgi:hypothetical protein